MIGDGEVVFHDFTFRIQGVCHAENYRDLSWYEDDE